MSRGPVSAGIGSDWGAGVAAARRAAGLTQAALARASGLSVGTIRDLEQGRTRAPTPESVRVVDRVLGRGGTPESGVVPAVRIAVLGPLHCAVDGRAMTLRGHLPAMLLAIAAVHVGELVSDAEYVDLLWPRQRPRDVVAALHAHVARLRREVRLGGRVDDAGPALLRERGGYRLRGDGNAIDTGAFAGLVAPDIHASGDRSEALLAALALWRGAVAADLPELMSHPRAVAWEQTRRDAAAELAVTALDRTADHGARAVAAVGAVLDVHLLDEELAARLVRLQTALGQPSDALATCARVRSAVADAFGVDLGAALIAAQAEALRQDAVTASVTTFRRSAPAELPRDIGDFVGRDQEIALMTAELQRSDELPGLIALVGMGGVGKSTLAVRVAHAVKDRFPDGQLYLDLRGSASRPVPGARAVDLLLRRLGVVVDSSEDDPAHRAALLRSALSTGRYLLVLDNAGDVEQIRDLVPGSPGSAAVITCRRSLAGLDGVTTVRLNGLDPAAAHAFLARHRLASRRHVGDDAALTGIAQACGNLPLALRLAMDHAAAAAADLTALHDSLVDSGTRWKVLRHGDRAVWACLETGWSSLGDDLRRTFGDLAALPGMDLPVAAALAAIAQDDDEHLVTLGELSLLELQPGRLVRMHDLLRDLGRRLGGRDVLAPDGPAARLIAWYSVRARSALAHAQTFVVRPLPASPEWVSTLAGAEVDLGSGSGVWMDSEYPVLLALVDAMTNGQAPFDWTLVFFVALAGQLRGEAARSTELLDAALQAVDPGDLEAVAFLSLASGRGHVYSSALTEGLVSLDRARRTARLLGNAALEVWALEGMGAAHDTRGENDAAAAKYTSALNIVRHSGGEPGLQSILLNNMGDSAIVRGRLSEAVGLFTQAITLSGTAGYERSRLAAIANLGLAAWWAGDDQRALELMASVTDALLEVGDAPAAAESLLIQTRAAVVLDRREAAETAAQRATAVVARQEDQTMLVRAMISAAMVEAQWHDLDRGVAGLAEARAVARRIGAPLAEIEALLAHGVPALIATRPDFVAAAAREAERRAVAMGNPAAQARAVHLGNLVEPAVPVVVP